MPNSEQIITASKDGTIRIWNINGKLLRHYCELYNNMALMVSSCQLSDTLLFLIAKYNQYCILSCFLSYFLFSCCLYMIKCKLLSMLEFSLKYSIHWSLILSDLITLPPLQFGTILMKTRKLLRCS
jgi:WD40 repeat protein